MGIQGRQSLEGGQVIESWGAGRLRQVERLAPATSAAVSPELSATLTADVPPAFIWRRANKGRGAVADGVSMA